MKNIQEIAIAEYDYPLPDERIAKYPLVERDTSKLLLYKRSFDVSRSASGYFAILSSGNG